MLQLVAEIPDRSVPRVLKENQEELLLELACNKWERIVQLDSQRQSMTWLTTNDPFIHRKNTDWSLNRWATAENRRSSPKRFDATWKDEDSQRFQLQFPAEHCTAVSCPALCCLVYYGGRRSASEGDGQVHCVSRGKLLWSVRLAKLPSKQRQLDSGAEADGPTAFPYNIVAPSDGSFVVVTYKDNVYLIGSDGQLRGSHPLRQLLPHLYGDSFLERPSKGATFDTPLGQIQISIEIGDDYEEERFAWPAPEAVKIAEGGTSVVVGCRDALVWFSSTGRASRALRIAEASTKQDAKIIRVETSSTSDLVVASLSSKELHVVSDGVASRAVPLAHSYRVPWALCNNRDILAVRMSPGPDLVLMDAGLNELYRQTSVMEDVELKFSPSGAYLFESGTTTRVYRLCA